MLNPEGISRNLSHAQLSELPEILREIPRVSLGNLPTPLQEAARFSTAIGGPRIFIKRDDLTGLATGGNKTRKLEYLIADALVHKADCIVTAGAPQSNSCRQAAAAAAKCGLGTHLVIGAKPPVQPIANFLLDQLFGAKVYWTERHLRTQKIAEVTEQLRLEGKKPYAIPIGGSNVTGAIGYVTAMFELRQQLKESALRIDRIVFATSSGGTQAGLMLGAHLTGFAGAITGISIDQVPDAESDEKYLAFVLDIANGLAKRFDLTAAFSPRDAEINYDYLGRGYGIVGELERDALTLLAQTEGILVGPVYTARALGGLIDLIKHGAFDRDENILFWHTGDDLTVNAYAEQLLDQGGSRA